VWTVERAGNNTIRDNAVDIAGAISVVGGR
jgi:hypothetical protein